MIKKIPNADKDFPKKLDFIDIKCPVKVRDIHKTKKKNSIGINIFSYENKEKHPIYISKNKEKHVDLLIIGEEGKRHYVLIKDYNTFICYHKLHCEENIFSFSTEEILKRHIKDCFKINSKQTIIMPKKGDYVKFKNYERKIQSPFIFYADFESLLVPQDNGKKYTKESYTKKYQKHIAGSYGFKLICVDDKFCKRFKTN